MSSTPETGGIEFERDPDKLDPELDPNKKQKRAPEREHFSKLDKRAPDERQTDPLSDEERAQQPVTGHQDRRHK